ncbi:MAG TPA: DNA recombination protein RmuC [Gammaproteobacteria bacterium]|nr:DNA recombination protein RmuC [Gammaproteobacteria bacterium]
MTTLLIITALIAGLILGYVVAALSQQRRNRALEIELATLKAKAETVNAAREELEKTFKAVASDVLRNNNQSFIELATQNLGKFQSEARGELDKRQQAFSELVKPISETLKKTEAQIHEIEKERKEAYGNITRFLGSMNETQSQLQAETRNLVQALRRPEVRGQWGEMTLRRLAELAGMVNYCDFFEQDSRDSDNGRMRPDMIVRMPDKRELVVDAKTPLDAYLNAVAAKTDEERQQFLLQHARKVRERMRELASKAYWNQYKNSPDFVVMFVPGEQFLSAALDTDPQLMEDAFSNKVVMTTPTSLIALLRAVAFGWRQQSVAENAEKIRELGEELYKRLATFNEHLGRVGRALGQSVEHYNKAVGSLERQVMPSARRFPEMGIHEKKSLEEPDKLEVMPRDAGDGTE